SINKKSGIAEGQVNSTPDGIISDTIVYSDYYTWHSESHWKRGFSDIPLLGFYDSLDSKIISKHLEWAHQYGIDVLKIEYIPQFDSTIKNGILKAITGKTEFCLMYDSRLRFESIGYNSPPYDFSDRKISMTFLEDMEHIALEYLSSPGYFKINGRPVLWLYVARDYTGRFREVIETARKNFLDKGYDVYLVGDVVFWNYRLDTITAFDAVSCYSAYAGRPQNTALLAERLKFLYMVWSTAARMQSKDFIPSAIPAYDDSCLEDERKSLPVLSGSGDNFKYQLEIISGFLDPVNISPDINQVTIATFNEHQEGSSVEPAQEWGFTRIEQIPEIFGYN
ncbi:MAG: hypothetical protein FJW66_00345, partial [Actinobacteria bacterium]|nr:hypothetical protein [Actinomycetota bacterium]